MMNDGTLAPETLEKFKLRYEDFSVLGPLGEGAFGTVYVVVTADATRCVRCWLASSSSLTTVPP